MHFLPKIYCRPETAIWTLRVEELKPNFQFPFCLIFCLSYVLFVFHRFLKGLFLLLFAYSVTACLASAAPFATYYFLYLIIIFFSVAPFATYSFSFEFLLVLRLICKLCNSLASVLSASAETVLQIV